MAAASCLSPAFHATPSAARESVAFRASPLPQPAPLLQMAHATLKAAPRPTFDPALFEALEASPLVDLTPVVATPGDDRSFAFELLDPKQRALALALDDWNRAAPRGIDHRRLRAAIVGFYVARDFMPLWLDGADWRQSARSAARRLREAGEDGLDISAYKIPAMEAGASRLSDEFALSEAVSVYVAQASGSRVDPRRISHLIGARPASPDMGEALTRVATAGDGADEVLQGFNPAHYGYRQLRAKLIELRSRRALGDVDPIGRGERRLAFSRHAFDREQGRAAEDGGERDLRFRAWRPRLSPIWSGGAGSRAISAGVMSRSIFRSSNWRSCGTAPSRIAPR